MGPQTTCTVHPIKKLTVHGCSTYVCTHGYAMLLRMGVFDFATGTASEQEHKVTHMGEQIDAYRQSNEYQKSANCVHIPTETIIRKLHRRCDVLCYQELLSQQFFVFAAEG